MKFKMDLNNIRKTLKYISYTVLSVCHLALVIFISSGASAQESIFTSYEPTIYEVVDESGFKHPGVGLTKDNLENVRSQVRAQKEPWNTYFNEMLTSSAASTTVGSSNANSEDPTVPRDDAFNSQGFNGRFIQDGLKSYTQAILYVLTGDEVYRDNALKIIRIWEQMDPAKYEYFVDSHIHTGIPLSRMVAAAEILRYTSTQNPELEWTDLDTLNFTNNLIVPVTETFNHTNFRFMNQHLYPLIGSISGYIFTGNRARYEEGVEWFTVNKTALDQGQNGAIKQLFRLVDTDITTGEAVTPPRVQHVEMGRDQAHGAGDITNVDLLARLLNAQNTKVDPVEGTVSTAENAIGPYEFLDNRILTASDYFAKFMLGYETPWTPVASHTDENGNPTIIYKELAQGYRGRLTQNSWEHYYYYKYKAGLNVEDIATYFVLMFAQRVSYNWDGVDGGGDFWFMIPPEAEVEGDKYLVNKISDPALREFEHRYSSFDGNSTAGQEGDTSFVEVVATEEGSNIALVGSGTGSKDIAFRIRTDGTAKVELGRLRVPTETKGSGRAEDTLTLPDTNGQWMYIPMTLNDYQYFSDLVYFTVKGAGAKVDFDHVNFQPDGLLTPPVFVNGDSALKKYTYEGSGAPISFDFSATDGETVTYQIDNLPEGAVFDESTGEFYWLPTQSGTYSLVVSATDGTSVVTREFVIEVAIDRQAAVETVVSPYDESTSYVSLSLNNFINIYDEVMGQISSASDEVFIQKLDELKIAVAGLQELTPLLSDGSMDYSNMLVDATFGNGAPLLLDNYAGSWVGGNSELTHIMDFGPDFKVSAAAFELQVRASFPERLGGTTVFGSNDKETWTRLTPGLISVLDEMQRLDVQDELKNERFRFIKIQAIEPTDTIFEMSELRIYGERYQTVNSISSVSIGSAQSLKSRIVEGDIIRLSFTSTEAIQNVNVQIQGQSVAASTADNMNWTSELVVGANATPGYVKFKINYKTANGVDAEETLFTTDGSWLFIADQSDYVDALSIGNLFDSSGRTGDDLYNNAGTLFDGDLATFSDFRLNGSGSNSYVVFDFKEGGEARLSRVEILARQDGYYSRIRGASVQGSNDNVNWTSISPQAVSTREWQTLDINSMEPYRYIRIYNWNNWYGNMAELRLHGDVLIKQKIDTVSISSDQDVQSRIAPGDTVTLSFTSTEEIYDVNVDIYGYAAEVSTVDNIHWTAQAVIGAGASPGTVTFSINYTTADGEAGPEKASTTEGSELYIPDETGLIKNVLEIADLQDSSGRAADDLLNHTSLLFDNNPDTVTDFRVDGKGSGAYVTFDFKEGGQARLSKVELLARQDGYYTRIKGAVVQGSNDNLNWTTISPQAASTREWQTLEIDSTDPYRYIRIYNWSSWYGNMAELRLYGDVKILSKLDTVTISSEQSVQKRILPGDTVTLSFDATEAIQDVFVNIHGYDATVSTDDNINWTAEAVMAADASPGSVTFSINYKTSDGEDAPERSTTSDGSELYIPDQAGLIQNVLEITDLSDSNGRDPDYLRTYASILFDNDPNTVTDFRLNGSGNGAYVTFDFKEGYQADLTRVELLARQDGYYTRIKGVEVHGSNDNENWTTISPQAVSTQDWQTLAINSSERYRYIRIYNWSSWFGNMAEVRLYGAVKVLDITPPVTTDDAPQEPTNQDVTVSLNAVDDGSGVAATYYTVNDGEQQTGNSVVLSADGTHTLAYWSVDVDGNVEELHTATITIDKTVPTATFTYSTMEPTDDVVVATIVASEQVVVTNNDGLLSREFIYNGSFTFEFVDAAGNQGSATATVGNINENAGGVPGDPELSFEGGIAPNDGDYSIAMNMWWGNNGKVYKLYENDVLIESKVLADNSPTAQSAVTSFVSKPNGTYYYRAELSNQFGTTESKKTLTVTIVEAEPEKPFLSHDNGDGDGNFSISMNMWWGTNGSSYRLYENGILIDTQDLEISSPNAQSVVTGVADKPVGNYEYRAELVNSVGVTSSDTISVSVTH